MGLITTQFFVRNRFINNKNKKMILAEIIKELNDKNQQVFQLKEFAKQIITISETDVTIDDIRTVIKVYKPKEIIEKLNN